MAKRGLGRGLGSLLGETAGEVVAAPDGTDQLIEVNVEDVSPNPDQPRRNFDEEELDELADSIRQNGILQPLVVRERGGSYQIVAGERRYQAARRAGLKRVPVVVRTVADDELMRLALIENLQRSDLNPIESAMGYQVLMEQNGLTQEEVGKLVSKSRSAVANTLRLLELPDEVLAYVSSGELSAGHARAILAVDDEEGRIALAEKVIAEQLSVRQTEILAPLFSGRAERVPPRRQAAPKAYSSAANRLRNRLLTRVSVRNVRGKHKIEIEFSDEDELNAIVGKILGEDRSEGER